MFFSRTKGRESSTLIISIESGAVRTGIVLRAPNQPPTLVYEGMRAFDGSAETSDRLIARMKTALEAACDDIVRDALPHIVARRVAGGAFDAIRYVYGAPWYVSRGRLVTIEHETPRAYSSHELDELVTAQGNELLKSIGEGLEPIERTASGWSVNGYDVADPRDSKGGRIAFRLFVSGVPASPKRTIEDIVARRFHAHTTSAHSRALVTAHGLSAVGVRNDPTLIIDVTGAMTELSNISHGSVLDAMTYPEGSGHAHAAWGKRRGRPAHEARAHATSTGSGIAMGDSWQAGITESIAAIVVGQTHPARAVVISDTLVASHAVMETRRACGTVCGYEIPVSLLAPMLFSSSVRVAAGASPGSPPMLLAVAALT